MCDDRTAVIYELTTELNSRWDYDEAKERVRERGKEGEEESSSCVQNCK